MISRQLYLWFILMRPKSWLASLSPVLAGGALAMAEGFWNWPIWIITALTAMLLQAIANLANDFFDYRHGFDLPKNGESLRIIKSGLLNPRAFAAVISVLSIIAVMLGLVLVWHGGWPILVIGVAALGAAFLYSAGPWPMTAHAMGEAAVVFFFGLMAGGGAYYLQTGVVTGTALLLSLAPGLISAGIMMVNNYRDLAIDRQTGKTTLAGLMGAIWFRRLFVLVILAAYLVVVLTALLTPKVSLWALLALLSLPLAFKVIRDVYTKTGPALSATVISTALLNFITSLLLSFGLQL